MARGSETGGCLNCYAARMASRNLPGLKSSTGKPLARILQSGPRWTGEVELNHKSIALPLYWRKPRRIFVNSMSDLFHELLTDAEIDQVFAVMALCPQHTFQVLTKRAERMQRYMDRKFLAGDIQVMANDIRDRLKLRAPHVLQGRFDGGDPQELIEITDTDIWPLRNVWLGVSVENQATADERSGFLSNTPATVRFISQEPQLDVINWTPEMLNGISQIIVGGESGPGARPFNLRWAYRTLAQCRRYGISCFIKQLGAKPGAPSCASFDCTHPDCYVEWLKLKDKKGGDWNDPNFPEALKVREFPA